MHPAVTSAGWSLMDAVTRSEAYPDLVIPDVQDRSWLLPGDTVKVGFEMVQTAKGERLWVTVTDRLIGERYRGELVSDPQLVPMTRGDGLTFAPHHVLEIYDDNHYQN